MGKNKKFSIKIKIFNMKIRISVLSLLPTLFPDPRTHQYNCTNTHTHLHPERRRGYTRKLTWPEQPVRQLHSQYKSCPAAQGAVNMESRPLPAIHDCGHDGRLCTFTHITVAGHFLSGKLTGTVRQGRRYGPSIKVHITPVGSLSPGKPGRALCRASLL
jgi:hypothetical protein